MAAIAPNLNIHFTKTQVQFCQCLTNIVHIKGHALVAGPFFEVTWYLSESYIPNLLNTHSRFWSRCRIRDSTADVTSLPDHFHRSLNEVDDSRDWLRGFNFREYNTLVLQRSLGFRDNQAETSEMKQSCNQ